MTLRYNAVAGQNLHRLEGLSDGVFAVAMTLLVLDLKTPVAETIHSEGQLWAALGALAPRLAPYLMSFLTLGIFWVGQQTQHHYMARSDRGYAWLSIVFLMVITLVPFSTALLAEFITYRAALLVYWTNLLLIGIMIAAMWRQARRGGLLKPETGPEMDRAVMRRVYAGQSLYALGAALCLFSTYWSIAFIVAVQLQYAIGIRRWPFDRL